MNLNRMMVVCALALGGLAVGCGDKCKSLCEDGQKCSDASAAVKSEDCGKQCDDLNKVSDAAGCNSQKDSALDCEDGIKDKCSGDTSCNDKLTAMLTCIVNYCTAHQTDSACTTYASDTGGSAN